jgi:hypothetical protein
MGISSNLIAYFVQTVVHVFPLFNDSTYIIDVDVMSNATNVVADSLHMIWNPAPSQLNDTCCIPPIRLTRPASILADKSLFNLEFYIGLSGDIVCPSHHYFKIPLDNFNILFYTIEEK